MNLKERQDSLIETLAWLDSWAAKFDYIMSLGDDMPYMPESLRTPDTIIKGCTSRTYFRAFAVDGIIGCDGWSNATIPSGLIALCREVFSGLTTTELANGGEVYFHTSSGLSDALTAARRDALHTMINRILYLII